MAETITAPAYHDGLSQKTALSGSERIIINDNASDKTATATVLRDFVADKVTSSFQTSLNDEAQTRLSQDNFLHTRVDNCDNHILLLEKAFCDMGEFETERKALDALGDIFYCASNANCILHAHYSKAGKECNMVCIQSFNDATVRQFLFNRDKLYQRCIYFTDASRTEIQSRDDWACAFPDRLAWDADGHKYVPSLFGHTFNAQYTDAIPLATSASAGLMTAAQVQTLDSASGEIGAMAYADAAMNAAAEAKKGFDDFKVWRAGTDASTLTLKVGSSTTATKYEASFPAATEYNAGIMTAEYVKVLKALLDAVNSYTEESLFRKMWAAASGKWTEAGGYTMNGLTLTYEEAVAVYTQTAGAWKNGAGLLPNGMYNALKCRTNIPVFTPFSRSVTGLFQWCPGLETAAIEALTVSRSMTYSINSCAKLTKISGVIDVRACTSIAECFKSCPLLKEMQLKGLRTSVNLSGAPSLNYDTMRYIVDEATNTAAITVTVGGELYNVITGAAAPTEERGGTAEQWAQLLADATARNISFASA